MPLSSHDYLELLPVRWQAITDRGIRINHRTYDHDLLTPYRGQRSDAAGRGGKWEIHYNPHDVRQVWVRLPDGGLTEIPWIHRDHVHQPFNDRTWQHVRALVVDRGDSDGYEADLADALDQLMRRARTGHGTPAERALMARQAPIPSPVPPMADRRPQEDDAEADAWGEETGEEDSLDNLDEEPDDQTTDENEDADAGVGVPGPFKGFGLYDAHAEAEQW
ncbi:Mu transposase C-terminal domain-containing protein [Streptomyces alboflavus]|uniref:Mu transposase C-terminal domain-containing protein n=1 Tax=Streptomyces alboflavus TaxID=67267 RepID=UPI003002A628